MTTNLSTATARVVEAIPDMPSLAIILGSGFRAVLEGVATDVTVPFDSVPGLATTSVPGHEGAAFVVARMGQSRVLFVTGRAHFYEGHSMDTLAQPLRILAAGGVRQVLLTHAAGGINESYRVGDLMCLSDHINLIGVNPLRGASGLGGQGFIDLTQLYSRRMNQALQEAGEGQGLRMHEGVYVCVSGPSFETPAEIRMFGQFGGDVVGMSAAPEAIVASHAGLEVAGLSFVTNLAAGRSPDRIQHDEVMASLDAASGKLSALLRDFCERMTGGAGVGGE